MFYFKKTGKPSQVAYEKALTSIKKILKFCYKKMPIFLPDNVKNFPIMETFTDADSVLQAILISLEIDGIEVGCLPHESFDLGKKLLKEINGVKPSKKRVKKVVTKPKRKRRTKAEIAAANAAVKPKRKRRTKAEIAAANAAAKPKRKRRTKAEIAAATKVEIAANAAAKPKRKRKTKAEIAGTQTKVTTTPVRKGDVWEMMMSVASE